jgi:hypothetical protein
MKTDKQKKKRAEYMREYNKRKPEKKKLLRKRYRENHKANQLKAKYGITVEEYQAMFDSQGGVCKLCGQEETTRISRGDGIRSLAVDHDHKTGKVRGLLCHQCNVVLGQYELHKDLFPKFQEYLDSTGG